MATSGVAEHNTTEAQYDVLKVGAVLNDVQQPLKARFRALFLLRFEFEGFFRSTPLCRNIGGADAIAEIGRCLKADESALLKHELAYCMGQMQDARAVPALIETLDKATENAMVRHEAGWQ